MASEQGPFYRALGERVKKARKDAKISQDSLARAVGLSRTSITNIEKGRQPVQAHLLVRIADALGATAASLLPQPKDGRRVADAALSKLLPESKRWVEKVLLTSTEPTRDNS